MNDLEGVLLFAGIPLAIVAIVFGLVFWTSAKPSREPITKPVMDEDAPKGETGADA
ncbi:hypothetical protein AB0J83_09080 [Actinoplanes sp. NPDC049596]|uniref:hypothetical protein n=1 Tax=unclassified Actinoplanes TaxID=2626549 RepID=UPI003443B260